ncbi:MAG: hypothetical protein HYX92_16940 [Chloroflexi bacterium]|nr:hypothetical protein [Chloroflexota bacterium]
MKMIPNAPTTAAGDKPAALRHFHARWRRANGMGSYYENDWQHPTTAAGDKPAALRHFHARWRRVSGMWNVARMVL